MSSSDTSFVGLYYRQLFVFRVKPCLYDPLADRCPFHQGSLCSHAHHYGYSSMTYLVIAYLLLPRHFVAFPSPSTCSHLFLALQFRTPPISLTTCAVLVVSAMVLTFQHPMLVRCLGTTIDHIGLWGSPAQALTQERHFVTHSGFPSMGCIIVNAFGLCNNAFFTGQGC